MEMKLTKTLLTTKPSQKSVLIGLLSFMVLVLIHWTVGRELSGNGRMVFEEGQYWRAFSTSLVHADLDHLGHNALFFTGLAILLNGYFGWFVFPLVSLLVGGVINLIALKIYPPEVFLVGISGVIYFMAAFWMIQYICIERRLTLPRRLINATAIALIFLFPEAIQHRTSYLAHGLGFGLGVPSGLIYFWLNKNWIRAQEVWVEKEPDVFFEEIEYMESTPQLPEPEPAPPTYYH